MSVSVNVRSAVPMSGADEQASSPMTKKQASKGSDAEEVGGEALVSLVAVQSRRVCD